MINKRKPRVFWMGEATFLDSGYGIYGKEILSRLHQTGKYEIAELGSYGHYADPKSLSIPWKYYGCLPDDQSQQEEYEQRMANQWGLWRFEEICLDFKPDIVIDIRDWWYGEYVARSPFRNMFKWAIMPTIDSAPQMEQWLTTYLDADYVCAYSEFGRDTMVNETNGRINFVDLASPAADYEHFKPVPDKQKHKEKMGLESNVMIVGTIMRNQKRKLYPDLIQAFKLFLEKYPSIGRNTFLYLHTAYPDIGWDIPRLIRESGIGHKILCTYLCQKCSHVFPSFFQDALQTCPKCGQPTAKLPSHTSGVSTKDLANVVNCFDLYVQYALAEGFGIPIVEAAACGIPVMAVDYSAMSSVVRNLKGIPIKVQRFFREAETHAYRAYPDNEDFVEKMAKFLGKSESERAKLGHLAYTSCRQTYSWDKAAKIWGSIIDGMPLENSWDSPPQIHVSNLNIPEGLSNEKFVKWCVVNIWGEPSQLDSYVVLRMIRDLNYGEAVSGYGGIHYAEDSLISKQQKFRKFTRKDVVNTLYQLCEQRNKWEEKRCGLAHQTDVPKYIQHANRRNTDD